MTPYRHETPAANEQPVRFYKMVAITFLILAIVLLGVIVFSSSKKATITITAKSDPVEVNFTGTVGGEGENQIIGKVVTTTKEFSAEFKPSETKEIVTGGEGKMILHNIGKVNQALVPTTRLMTDNGAIFRIKNRVEVPAGGELAVEVYFDSKNTVSSTGVGTLTIPGLSLDKQKEIYATNNNPITGTRKVGVVSKDDLKNAEKSFVELAAKEIENQVVSSTGVGADFSALSKTLSYVATSTVKIGDEVDNFYLKGKVELVVVLYKSEQLIGIAKNELNKKVVSDAEFLKTSSNIPTVKLVDYSTATGVAKLDVYYNGVVTLNPDSKQLSRSSFFGKSEQEVRRYLLSLDHVQGVTLNFSPIWCSTVPSITDHVSVVVKSVE